MRIALVAECGRRTPQARTRSRVSTSVHKLGVDASADARGASSTLPSSLRAVSPAFHRALAGGVPFGGSPDECSPACAHDA
ncbi:hypothetical protein A0H81_10408 [Grifola frondosa]|uniref:Uncharacterized protein n=1 Tax=Grifola frondosa TaxID=5627 RepID=A0A1C7LZU5_GRIFR|nr:hypothetical protein A0H81_10408 [Grifola frondosa]